MFSLVIFLEYQQDPEMPLSTALQLLFQALLDKDHLLNDGAQRSASSSPARLSGLPSPFSHPFLLPGHTSFYRCSQTPSSSDLRAFAYAIFSTLHAFSIFVELTLILPSNHSSRIASSERLSPPPGLVEAAASCLNNTTCLFKC